LRPTSASENEARGRFFAVDRNGLLVEGMNDIQPAQRPFVQPRSVVADWRLKEPGRIGLIDVVANARPTVLIGVSGQAGAIGEEVVRTMASQVERPIIFPLSGQRRARRPRPTIVAWTGGRAIIGTGSRSLP
jgi:malate dehydrogenase (oxaloacetate-decarboxylating)